MWLRIPERINQRVSEGCIWEEWGIGGMKGVDRWGGGRGAYLVGRNRVGEAQEGVAQRWFLVFPLNLNCVHKCSSVLARE